MNFSMDDLITITTTYVTLNEYTIMTCVFGFRLEM